MLVLNFSPFPTLLTQRLVLREITTNDAQDLFEMRSNPALMRFIDRPLAQSINDSLKLIELIINSQKNNEGITWGISIKGTPTLIGTIGFWRIQKEHYRAEIGYLLHADYQGKGIMQEAMDAAIGYAFKTLHIHSIEANINPDNVASIKLAEKNGFVREAYFKENFYYNGEFKDTVIYSLLDKN